MLKRYILLTLLGMAVIVVSLLAYFKLRQEPDLASPYQAMPTQTAGVLVLNNYSRTFDHLLLNNLMWQELRTDDGVHSFGNKIMVLDSLIRHNEWSADLSEDFKWYIAFHASKGGYKHSIVIPMMNENELEFSSWFEQYASGIMHTSDFEEVEIRSCNFKNDLFPPLFFAFHQGLFLASFENNILEEAIQTLHGGKSLYTEKDFRKVESTSGKFADWNFFLNYRDPGSIKLIGLDAGELLKSKLIWSDWVALDATIHADLVLMNGFTHSSGDSFLDLFAKQKAQDADVIEIIPEDAAMFFHFGVSNYKSYSLAKKVYFEKTGKKEAYDQKVESMMRDYGFDIESEFDNWVSNEFGIIYLNNNNIEASDSKVAYFRLSDIKRTTAILNDLADLENMEWPYDIPGLQVQDFFEGFESDLFHGFNRPFYLILDKYLLMSSHYELLDKMRKQYLAAKTLKKSESYASFAGNLSDQSNVFLYLHLEKGFEAYQSFLSENTLEFLDENAHFLKKFEQIGIQFKTGKKNLYYQHMAMNFNPRKRSQGKTLWDLALDTQLISKPAIVYNHYTNAREILVQDARNTLYLIDNKGNVLWKRQMKEKIKDKVYQIDVYKNNKLQMLFSGESSIYLVDRKGRDVENFPVKLPAVATSDLKVIDYEKNREYRILIGVRGGEVLNYDRFGKKIKGWSFNASDEISYPIHYFFLNGKDYIVMAGEEGRPYIVNRRGQARLELNENIPPYDGRDYHLDLSNDIDQCKFVTTDDAGNFVKLSFKGEKEIVNLDMISENHHFMYDDINHDRKNDYVLLDSNKLMVYNHNREKMFEIELEGNDPEYLNMYRFDSGYGRIGFTDVESEQVYLYRDAGGLDPNFPLKGNTAFTIIDLNKDGRQNLIVGLGNKLMVYNLK